VGTPDTFKFGEDFELDVRAYQLRSAGIPLKLKPIPMEVLRLLVERRGQLVTREQIVERIWGAGVALDTDNSINGAISRIRQVLRDDPDTPRYVQTVPSRGYRFIAPVEPGSHEPAVIPSAGRVEGQAEQRPEAMQLREIQVPMAVADAGKTVASAGPKFWNDRWKLGLLTALVVVGAMPIGWRLRARQASQLTEKDTIVVADFANNTGDPIFDETLRQALSVQLTQSPFLNVASDLKVNEMLRRMGRAPDEALTRELAREACLRLGGKAILAGSISGLGSHYLVSLQALGCASGDLLAAAQMEAPNKESVLKALDGAAAQVRSKVGESMASLEKYDFPMDATTNSLEALKAFSLGSKALRERGEGEAIPFLRRAVELDPEFALAYATLGRAYEDVGEDGEAANDFGKAFQLRERLSERERYYVTTLYNEIVTGDMEQAKESGELWVRAYPRDGIAREKLGTIYGELGEDEKADAQFEEALKLDPDSTINVFNSVLIDAALNRMEEAQQILDAAKARGVDGSPVRQAAYAMAFLRNDALEMEKQVAWALGKPITQEGMLSQHADSEAYYGQLRKAHDLSKRAIDAGTRDKAKEMAALCMLAEVLRKVETGGENSPGPAVREAVALAPGRNVKIQAALVLARHGDAGPALALTKELESAYPANTLIQFYWLPIVKASLALKAGNEANALVWLEKTTPYELGQPSNLSNVTNMYPIYLRGQAYLLANNGHAAAAEFRKILENPGIVQNGILGALSRLELARAEAFTGDAVGARKHYGEFFALWKDADPNIPILKDAHAEYAKLN
jgi:DNA-binding winged helix-turn-helix (wHTH) protein/Flp pilus assembly protein TadD